MRNLIHNLPTATKLRWIIMLTSGGALLLACIALLLVDYYNSRNRLVVETTVLADVVGRNSAAALDFHDVDHALDTLEALRAKESFVAVAIYTPDGALFANLPFTQHQHTEGIDLKIGHDFRGDLLQVVRPIHQRDELVGKILVMADLRDLRKHFAINAMIVSVVFLGALLVALLLAQKLHRWVAGPLLELAAVSRRVAQDQILKHRKALGDLRESHERFELVTLATSDIIYDWDFQEDKTISLICPRSRPENYPWRRRNFRLWNSWRVWSPLCGMMRNARDCSSPMI